MVTETLSALPEAGDPRRLVRYQPGDLVISRSGYPTLYVVISIGNGRRLRLRGVDWAVGYSALVSADEVRLASGTRPDE